MLTIFHTKYGTKSEKRKLILHIFVKGESVLYEKLNLFRKPDMLLNTK